MKRFFLLLLVVQSLLHAAVSDKEIANMFMLGFYGERGDATSAICKDLQRGLGGVILFGKRPDNRNLYKNFRSAASLRALTKNLKACNSKVLIAVDQEGGVVQRIKYKYKYPKASQIATLGMAKAKQYYALMKF